MFCSYSNLSLLQHFIEVAVNSRLLDVLGHPGDEGISVLEVGVKVGLEKNQIGSKLAWKTMKLGRVDAYLRLSD